MVRAGRVLAFLLVAIAVGGLFFLAPGCKKKRTLVHEEKLPAEGLASSAAPANSAASWTPRAIAKLDMHTHIDPEIAVPARRFLEAQGIGRVVNLSGGWAGEGLEETLGASKAAGDFYLVFANINFEGIGTPKWAARELAQLERA